MLNAQSHQAHSIGRTPTTGRARRCRSMTILDVLDDPNLFGQAFRDRDSWQAWRAFLAAVFGLPMIDEDTAIYRRLTGRTALPSEPAREAWVIAGRRAGKSRIAALLAVYVA